MKKNIIILILTILSFNSISQSISETKKWLNGKLQYHYCTKRTFQGSEEEYSYDVKTSFNDKLNVLRISKTNIFNYTSLNNWNRAKTNDIIEIKLNNVSLDKTKYQEFKCSDEEKSCSTSLALRFFIYTNNNKSVVWKNEAGKITDYSDGFWFDIPNVVVIANENLGERLKKAFTHLFELSGSKRELF